jgi:hypothetical protein
MREVSSFHVEWHGDKVLRDTRAATKWGIDSVMADCVKTAMSNHAWVSGGARRKASGAAHSSANLMSSHRMQPAEDRGDEIIGYWGVFANNYAIFLEEGTKFIQKGKYTWLVPASEKHYPSLSHRIAAKLAWG